MQIDEEIKTLLQYKNLKQTDLARLLKVSPQHLYEKLQAKNLNLQFLTKVADATDTTLQIYFQDNKYKKKIDTSTEILLTKINNLNPEQKELITKIIDNFKS